MFGYGLGGANTSEAPVPAGRLDSFEGLRPEGGRIGIEPEHDTAAALLHKRREPIAEVSRTPGQGTRLDRCKPSPGCVLGRSRAEHASLPVS
jgi:hypothetical protein